MLIAKSTYSKKIHYDVSSHLRYRHPLLLLRLCPNRTVKHNPISVPQRHVDESIQRGAAVFSESDSLNQSRSCQDSRGP